MATEHGNNAVSSDGEDLNVASLDIEAARGALDELFGLARQYRDSAKFRQLLEFVSRFRRYSAFNAMLVHIQMPGARYVLPAKQWVKKYKRVPVRDAQPLVMLQPMSPIMFGFDVSQTEGKRLPDGFADPFRTEGTVDPTCLSRTVGNARRDGIDIQFRSLGANLGGYVRNAGSTDHIIGLGMVHRQTRSISFNDREIDVFAEITLNSNLPMETNYGTIVHELGHLYCGHVGSPSERFWPDRRTLSKCEMEFEAESVSYLVCQRAGLMTPAVEYLHGYLDSNGEVPAISLEAVFKATQLIESMALRNLPLRSSDRNRTPQE